MLHCSNDDPAAESSSAAYTGPKRYSLRDLAHDRPTMYVCILSGTLDVDRHNLKQVGSVEKLATPELSAFKSCMVCVIEIAVC